MRDLLCDVISYCASSFNLCFRLRNDLYCVGWGVKLYSLTHFKLCYRKIL